MAEGILDKRLILVGGKGGVGKSTMAAAIASAAARSGRRTLLFEANANDRFGSFFDHPPVGPTITQLRDNLFAVNTTAAAALEEYGMMVLKFRRVYRLVFENRVTRNFLRAIPGLEDYSIIGKCWFHSTEMKRGAPVWDTIVFDMPASGHSLSLLRIPKVILETVPEGPLTRDARSLQDLLHDRSRTAFALVTIAEEMPFNEARDLSATLESELGIQVAQLLVNQVYPNRFPAGSPQSQILDAAMSSISREPAPRERTDGTAPLQARLAHADLVRHRRALNETYIEQLKNCVSAPQSVFPLLFTPRLGPAEIESLSRMIENQVG